MNPPRFLITLKLKVPCEDGLEEAVEIASTMAEKIERNVRAAAIEHMVDPMLWEINYEVEPLEEEDE